MTLAGRQVVPGVIMKLSPKQEAALEKAYMFGCYGKDPREQGLKDIANWVLKPKGTVEQVEAWFEARRARGARGEEVEVKEEEVEVKEEEVELKEEEVGGGGDEGGGGDGGGGEESSKKEG